MSRFRSKSLMIVVVRRGSCVAAFVQFSVVSHQGLDHPPICEISVVGCCLPSMSSRTSIELSMMNGMKQSTLYHEDCQSAPSVGVSKSVRSFQSTVLCLVILATARDVRMSRNILDRRAALMSSMTRACCWTWSTITTRACGVDFTGSLRHFVSIAQC